MPQQQQTDDDEDKNYRRPRRPNPDTVAYLRSLPLDLNVALSEIEAFRDAAATTTARTSSSTATTIDNTTSNVAVHEFPSSLAAALQAVYEIRHELASLAGDEYGAQCVETLCHITMPVSTTATRILLYGVIGQQHGHGEYAIHLATHRYGSHVLQTMLQLASRHNSSCRTNDTDKDDDTVPTTNDLACHADAPMIPNLDEISESVTDLMLRIATSVQDVAGDLAVHVCGSHCLRTILCWLGGVEWVQQVPTHHNNSNTGNWNHDSHNSQRRGKLKAKQKKKHGGGDGASSPMDGSGIAKSEPHYMVYAHNNNNHGASHPSPAKMEVLRRLTTALTMPATKEPTTESFGPGLLQSWACHASAGPVLTVLVQVWTYIDAAMAEVDDTDHSSNSTDHGDNVGNGSETLRQQQRSWEAAQATPDRHLCQARPEPRYREGSVADTIVRRILCCQTEQEQQQYGSDVWYGMAGEPRGSHCLETIVRVAPDGVYNTLLLEVGKLTESSTMQEYVHDPVSNFVIQTILQTIRTTNQAHAILDALEPTMSYILEPSHKRRWILWRMAEMAGCFVDCQEKFVTMTSDAFSRLANDSRPNAEGRIKLNKCLPELLRIVPPAQYGDRVQVDLAGTRAVHHMLRFAPHLCKDTIKGLMESRPDDLELLAKDALASRCILDALLEGPNVEHPVFLSALKRLFTKLKGRWVSISIDRVGHHTVMKLFAALETVDKRCLVEELISGKHRMNGSSIGRNLLDALDARLYELHGDLEWSKSIKRKVAKKEWLKEIVERSSTKRGVSDIIPVVESFPNAKKQRVTTSVDTIMDAISIPNAPKC